jgi:O-antigen/teichoic acid export membrane protein
MSKKVAAIMTRAVQSPLLTNSFWGIASNILQNVFVSLFFIILAWKYLPEQFADFLVANTLYQVVAAFSAMGLGQWFIREYVHSRETAGLTNRFIKFQFIFGFIFYFINILLAFILYDEYIIRLLSIVLGMNVLFDNIIYGIRHLNIAELKQKKTFAILIIDALLRMLTACILFVEPLSVLVLSCILVLVRFITLNLFLKVGSSSAISARTLLRYPVSMGEVKKIVGENWTFVVIGSVSVIFWRLASMVVSKMLKDIDLANYEISFKIFSVAQVIPLIVSASVFPMLVKKYQESGVEDLKKAYRWLFLLYAAFGITSFAFIFSFSDYLIPLVFGDRYANNPVYTKEMFLTMLVFPTALLQANVIVAIKQERVDMLFNILALLLNTVGCIAGIHYYGSLSAVNYSIFIAFVVFHVMQDIFLVRQRIANAIHVLLVYLFLVAVVAGYIYLSGIVNPFLLFGSFCMMMAGVGYVIFQKVKKAATVP